LTSEKYAKVKFKYNSDFYTEHYNVLCTHMDGRAKLEALISSVPLSQLNQQDCAVREVGGIRIQLSGEEQGGGHFMSARAV
jgi:hypothetical protein